MHFGKRYALRVSTGKLSCQALGRMPQFRFPEAIMVLATAPISDVGTGVFPALLLVQGTNSRTLALDHSPFTVGRNKGKDLVIIDPHVSRDHAVILFENDEFFV